MEDITGDDSFPATIPVPEPGDLRKAWSVVGAFQALASQCRYLLNRSGIAAGGGGHAWTDDHSFSQDVVLDGAANEVRYADMRLRRTLHLLRGTSYDSNGRVEAASYGSIRIFSGDQMLQSGSAPTFYHEVDLPEGAVLTGWRMLAFTNVVQGGSTIRGSVQLSRIAPDFAGMTGTRTDIGAAVPTTGNMLGEPLAASDLSAAVDATSMLRFALTLTAAADGHYIDFGRYGLELTWLDPGPRNY